MHGALVNAVVSLPVSALKPCDDLRERGGLDAARLCEGRVPQLSPALTETQQHTRPPENTHM